LASARTRTRPFSIRLSRSTRRRAAQISSCASRRASTRIETPLVLRTTRTAFTSW